MAFSFTYASFPSFSSAISVVVTMYYTLTCTSMYTIMSCRHWLLVTTYGHDRSTDIAECLANGYIVTEASTYLTSADQCTIESGPWLHSLCLTTILVVYVVTSGIRALASRSSDHSTKDTLIV